MSEMAEVSAATASKTKKSVDHKLERGSWLNSSGMVINNNPGPPATSDETIVSGDCVKAKAAGNITTPARIATNPSNTETCMAV